MEDESSRNPEQPAQGAESGSAGTGKPKVETDELLQEFNQLGRAIADAVRAAWASEERKKLEADLNRGLATVVDSIEDVVEKLGQSQQTRRALDRAEEVAESVGKRVRESDVTAEVVEGLRNGLVTLTEQLQKISQDLSKAGSGGTDAAQDIPVDQEEGEKPEEQA